MKVVAKVALIILAILIIILVIGVLAFRILFVPPSQRAVEKDFKKNQENIFLVTSYLATSQYMDIYITHNMDSGTMFVNVVGIGDTSIDDLEVVDSIDRLFRNGYQVITKHENTIHFQRFSTLDFGSGVAYSIDGSEPQLQFLTKLIPLSEPNWYYYEKDFNEWEARNEGKS